MKSNKALISVALILAAVLLLGIGFAIGRNSEKNLQIAAPTESTVPETTAPADEAAGVLGITVDKDVFGNAQYIPAKEIGGNFNQCLYYYDIQGAYITIDGTTEKLEDALKNGDITEEEIFYRARQDARNGICEETFESKHGVSCFRFQYPEYAFWLVYDVFAAPDGEEHLISQMLFYLPSENHTVGFSGKYRDPDTSLDWAREDWGLTFELENPTTRGAAVVCTQTGGQQIGQLKVTAYDIYFLAGNDSHSGSVPKCEYEIPMDGSGQFTIDWSETYGELPSGSYRLDLWIYDIYDESQVHPLMDNFRDWQVYSIEFTIP